VWQYAISALAMVLTYGLLVAKDNLSREYEPLKDKTGRNK
jgi:hypothetical protein